MNLFQLFKNVSPFVKPYKWLVFITLILTLIGSLMAQVNAIVLDWTVDEVNDLVSAGEKWGQRAMHIVILISSVLLGKEILSAIIPYAQNYYGERMRIFVSRDLSQSVIEKMLPIVDSFERGLEGLSEEQKADPFAAGMDKVYRQLLKQLDEMKVEPIEALGKTFDANLHYAVMHEEVEGEAENVVTAVLQKGYTYKGTVIRYSMVKVAN